MEGLVRGERDVREEVGRISRCTWDSGRICIPDHLHLHAIVSTVRTAGQSALAHAVAQIMLSPAQRGKEKANFCSDSLSDAAADVCGTCPLMQRDRA